jgi:hypothetical protein
VNQSVPDNLLDSVLDIMLVNHDLTQSYQPVTYLVLQEKFETRLRHLVSYFFCAMFYFFNKIFIYFELCKTWTCFICSLYLF